MDDEEIAIADEPMLSGEGLVKRYDNVVALDGCDFALYSGEVLAIVGDNGSGKSTLIRCLSGAEMPERGIMRFEGRETRFRDATDGRAAGINTSYQSLSVAADDREIANNLLRGSDLRESTPMAKLGGWLEERGIRKPAAVPRTKVFIFDEPTAALGTRAAQQVRHLIETLRGRGTPVVCISHNMPQVLAIADRIHVQRLGRRVAVVTPSSVDVPDLVAIINGAVEVDVHDQALGPVR